MHSAFRTLGLHPGVWLCQGQEGPSRASPTEGSRGWVALFPLPHQATGEAPLTKVMWVI